MDRGVRDSLRAEPCETAIKGWSVSTKKPLQKGTVVGGAAPLLVHQTLANREQEANGEVEDSGKEKGVGEGVGGIWRCGGGSPCDEVYCSARCRAVALVGGHGLICLGGSGPGSPLFEFHRYAVRTSETYLIAAVAVAAALSSSTRLPSSAGGKGVDKEEGGTRPFEALDGWGDPYSYPARDIDGDGEEDAGGGGAGRRPEGAATATGAVKGIGVSLEEAEEAWSMLTTGLLYGRNGDQGAEGWDKDEHALSLDFFLRLVRALGRHLAPISVPSPLVSYCARMVQASSETKARALPWLAPAIERAGPFGGADGGEGVEWGREGPNAAEEGGGVEAEGGQGDSNVVEEGDAVMLGERGLCRLVQASGAAAGTASSPFPPLSVVGLLPSHCTPQHSCVPNVQLETFLLPATTGAFARGGNKCISMGSGDVVVGSGGANDIGVANGEASSNSCDAPGGKDSRTALRVGLVTLRGVRAGEKLFAPYVALGQSVEGRWRELSTKFTHARVAAAAAAATVTAAAATAAAAEQSAGAVLARRARLQMLLCSCPRCTFEAGGDSQSCGREMLKILADQALEEGSHDTALRLYKASLSVTRSPSAPDPGTSTHTAGSGAPPQGREQGKGDGSPAVLPAALKTGEGGGRRRKGSPVAGERDGAKAEETEALTAEEAEEGVDAATVGDALHGVGVALLAAGRFREACRAWESGFSEAPHHPALQAQAEKEAAYRPRPSGEDGANGLIEEGQEKEEEGEEGPPPPQPGDSKEQEPAAARSSATGGLCGAFAVKAAGRGGGGGDSDGGCTLPSSFASTPGGAADIFLSRTAVLSSEECRAVIRAAEEYSQANGGWTTSRHYAVPTTDLPVHVLTAILPWFRSLVSERLFPTLAEQFGLAGGARRVFVHDAFVVRYEEGRQRHLPLHRDQSTHSFTIALNGLDQYSGGGTFFPCLGRSVRPPEGHALSFRGDILHGGDPLLRGVRYIIACFCYYDADDADGSRERGGGGGGGERGGGRTLEGESGGECRKTAEERRARGDSSGGGKDDAGERGRGIEFRSDEAFSFGFGLG
eukprot:g9200.t1